MVEGVVELAAELEFERFERGVEALVEGDVEGVVGGAAAGVAGEIAEGAGECAVDGSCGDGDGAGGGRVSGGAEVDVLERGAVGGGFVEAVEGDAGDAVGAIEIGSAIAGGDSGDGVGGGRVVVDLVGEAGGSLVDGGDLPLAEDLVDETAGVHEAAVTAEGQLVDERGGVDEGLVVLGLAVVSGGVADVLEGGRVGFEGGAGVIEGMRPGEGVEQREAGDHALLVANLERVVVGVGFAEGDGDVAVGGDGTGEVVERILLVEVAELEELEAVIADVGEVEEGVLARVRWTSR